MKNKDTSWSKVADWYDGLIEDSDDSYQKKVVLPNLIRMVAPKEGMTIVDIGCGQGYFSRVLAGAGARVTGCDISSELIRLAIDHSNENKSAVPGAAGITRSVSATSLSRNAAGRIDFKVASSNKLSFADGSSADAAIMILSLQNIEDLAGTISECARVLKKGGRLIVVINHPAFRVLRDSSWQWDEKSGRQYRRIDSYMSDSQHKIDMTPGEKDPAKKRTTFSFHRPLQSYFKAFDKSGLAVSRLEEWISHRKSQPGPRAAEEDRTRKEIPLFLAIEAVKL
jgi:ubiquinone/menaquinone biosynthesis C-methylase UbiE